MLPILPTSSSSWLVIVALGWVFACALGWTARRYFAVALLAIFPVEKDGPLDLDLWAWKLAAVAILLLVPSRASRDVRDGFECRGLQRLLWISLAWTLTSLSLSERPDLCADHAMLLAATTGLFVLFSQEVDARFLRMGLRAMLVVAVLIAVLALIQFVTVHWHLDHPLFVRLLPPEMAVHQFQVGLGIDERGLRLPSVFYHSNQLGHYMGMVFGVSFALFLNGARASWKIGYGLVLALSVVGCLISQSRTGVAMMAVQAVALLSVHETRKRRVQVRSMLVWLTTIACCLLLVSGNVMSFARRLFGSGLADRQVNWSSAAQLIPDNLLYGVGPGSAPFHVLRRFPSVDHADMINSYLARVAYGQGGGHAHNYVLNTLLETGALSLIVQLLIYITVILMGLKLVRSGSCRVVRVLAAGSTVPLGCEFVRGAVESYSFLAAPETGAMTAFLMAVICYAKALDKRRRDVTTFQPRPSG